MYTLGIDTSNYATSLAVYDSSARSVCVMLKKFLPVKEGALGLRQSEAVFHHTAALPELLRELDGQFCLQQINAVGVSVRPRPVEGSYMPCFLVGEAAAQSFALSKGLPVVSTSHQQGHLTAALYAAKREDLYAGKALVFHVSGGTTELLLCDALNITAVLGESLDLYAGQAVDRLGVKLGFAFPAGPEVSRLAAECSEKVTPKISLKDGNCHFSGLENQYTKLLEQGASPAYAAKYCLIAVAKTLAEMLKKAQDANPGLPCICAGGVMSSDVICGYMEHRFPGIAFVPGQYSSDNAAGVAIFAAEAMENG